MKPIFSAARKVPMENKRIVFAEGEEERVLRAVQLVVDEKLASPILIGRPGVIAHRIERFGLRLREGVDFAIVNPEHDERFRDYWETYYKLMARKGVTPQYAKLEMRRRSTLIGAVMIHKGEADGMICGTVSNTAAHLRYIDQVIGGTNCLYAAMNGLVLPGRQIFLTDTHVNVDPTAEQLAEITIMAAEELCRFGIQPQHHVLLGVEAAADAHGAVLNAKGLEPCVAIERLGARVLRIDAELDLQDLRRAGMRDGNLQQTAGQTSAPMRRVNEHAPQHRLVRDLRQHLTPQASNAGQFVAGKRTEDDLVIRRADAVARVLQRAHGLLVVGGPEGGGGVQRGLQAQRLEGRGIVFGQRADGDGIAHDLASTTNSSPVSKNAPPDR
jgi:phosphotransacetylase